VKIVNTDNFGSDYHDESVVAEGITNKEYAGVMCHALNATFGGDTSPRYFKIVKDDYVLQPGFEP
jgi:hypothetical protein